MSFLSACNSILHSFLCYLHGDRQQHLGSCHSPGQSHLLSTGYPPKLSMPFSTKHCFYFQLSLVALLCDNFGFLDKANLSIFATSFNSVSFEELKLFAKPVANITILKFFETEHLRIIQYYCIFPGFLII